MGHFGTAGEPFGIGPRLHHRLGQRIAFVGLFFDVVKLVKHQQGFFQTLGGDGGAGWVVEQVDQRCEVEAAQHGAQQFRGFFGAEQGAFFSAMGHRRQIAGLDLGRIVHTGGHAVGDEVHQGGLFALGRVFQQLNEFASLLGAQWQGGNAQSSAFGHMVTVGFQHCKLQKNQRLFELASSKSGRAEAGMCVTAVFCAGLWHSSAKRCERTESISMDFSEV